MKQSFNENWICYKTGDKENAFAVTLPHDAMQLDERSETSAGGVNTCLLYTSPSPRDQA